MPNQRKRWPLLIAPENRDDTTDKDSRLINCYIEASGDKENRRIQIFQRPGYDLWEHSVAGTTGQGIYNWVGNIYSIVDGTVYKDGVALTGSVDTTGGGYTFSSTLGGTPSLFMNNGVKMYRYAGSGNVIEVTDPDLITDRVKGSAYLDGTTYIMNRTANIQGSNINSLSAWAADNVIIAQIEPDGGVFISKQLVYVVAFKQWTTEMFYDAANATGSPLGTVQGAMVNEGCRHQDSVADLDGALFWVSANRDGGSKVFYMESARAQQVSTAAIERLLQDWDYTGTIHAWTARIGGHKFYGVTSEEDNITLVFDLSTQGWSQWTDGAGDFLPWVSSTHLLGQTLIQRKDGSVVVLNMEAATDAGEQFHAEVITPNWDGEVRNRKTVPMMYFITDQVSGSKLEVRTSDDDYQTWSEWREVDLSVKDPVLSHNGTFRRRAIHMRHVGPTKFRISAVEFDVLLGSL